MAISCLNGHIIEISKLKTTARYANYKICKVHNSACWPINANIIIRLHHIWRHSVCRRHRRHMQEATQGDLLFPRTRTVTFGSRDFAVSGPMCWNSLPSFREIIIFVTWTIPETTEDDTRSAGVVILLQDKICNINVNINVNWIR